MHQVNRQAPLLTAEAIAERLGRVQTKVSCVRCGAPGTLFVRPKPDRSAPLASRSWLCDGCAEFDHQPRRWRFDHVSSVKRSERRLAALNLPPTHAGASLDAFNFFGSPADRATQARALDFGKWYVNTWSRVPPLVALFGPPGNGKRTLAFGIARELALHRPVYVRYVRARVVTEEHCSHRRALRLIGSGLLLVTQLNGQAIASRHSARLLRDILYRRYAENRPTILTIDEPLAGLASVYAMALPPRLARNVKRVYSGSASARSATREAK